MSALYPAEGRDNNFQLIRLVAASAVVLTHSFSILTGRFDSEPLVSLLQRSIGHYAVDLFFILSGFLVTQSLFRNPDLLRYALARSFRIFPGLIAAVLGSALVLGPLVSVLSFGEYFGDPVLAKTIIGAVSTVWVDGTLPGVFIAQPEVGNINEPLWTLKYELTAYVSLMVVTFVTLRLGKWWPAVAVTMFAAAYIVGRWQFPWLQSDSAMNNLIHLMLVFYFGAAVFVLRNTIPLTLPGLVAFWGLAILAHDTQFREVTELLAIGYTLFWVAFVPNLSRSQFARIGDYSYGIYIYAYPIQQTIGMFFPQIMPMELFAASMVCVLPIAMASWHYVENPALGLGRTVISRLKSWRVATKEAAAGISG